MLSVIAAAEQFAAFGFPCCVCGLWVGCVLLGLAFTTFWLWMLIEAATKEPSEGNDKIIWILIIIFAHGIGALIYYLVRRPERIRKYGR